MDYGFKTKDELIKKMISYTQTPDDDNIRFKNKIKEELLNCPELLYVLHNEEYEKELFNEDGTINEDGEWDKYFGDNIRDYLIIPEPQAEVKNFLCYQTSFAEVPLYNAYQKYMVITFKVFCDNKDVRDKKTGITRHDMIGAIIREKFAWSNIFSLQCKITSDKETTTDSNYACRTIVFEVELPNSRVQTKNGKTGYINIMR